eukprot:TRINITY_DN16228_c0_g1_i1.p1 TRINITY_DN16228_c0_g1~~TRINITY_DN16228_c0_g1_i1.p1  ORF type:complete len:447 (-),score=95.98 TRINITY_DN16228_c0_g1_i1:26-1333(-)
MKGFILIIFLLIAMYSSERVDTLKVSLYPVIPAATETLLEVLKLKFEKRNPDIKLELRKFDSEGDYYNEEYLESLFTKEGYDVIEIDNMFLGHFINNDLLDKIEYDLKNAKWNDYAKSIVKIKGDKKRIYAIPHWLCKSFIFSRDEKIEEEISIKKYFEENSARFPNKPMFAGTVMETWFNSLMYFGSSAYKKLGKYSNYNETWERLYNLPVLKKGSSTLETFSKFCVLNNDTQSVYEKQVEYFHRLDLPYQNFIEDKVVSYSAFGETLHSILSDIQDDQKIFLNDLRFTNKFYQDALPMTSLDVFILRKNVTSEKKRNVMKFLEFINSYEITKLISLHKDSLETNRIPRFLFPANLDHSHKLIHASRKYGEYYRKFKFYFANGSALPINGFVQSKQYLYPHIFSSVFGGLPIPVSKKSQIGSSYPLKNQRYYRK